MENRLGHWNGDIPKYLDWNEKASRMRGSEKYACSSRSSERHGRKSGSNRNTLGFSMSRQLKNGDSRHG